MENYSKKKNLQIKFLREYVGVAARYSHIKFGVLRVKYFLSSCRKVCKERYRGTQETLSGWRREYKNL